MQSCYLNSIEHFQCDSDRSEVSSTRGVKMTSTSTGSQFRASRPLLVCLQGDELLEHPRVQRLPVTELRLAMREYARLHEGGDSDHPTSPEPVVALEVDVLVADEARQARRVAARYMRPQGNDRICYIGTPSGLRSLLRDIHAIRAADAVVLIPIDGPSSRSAHLVSLVAESFRCGAEFSASLSCSAVSEQ